MAKYTSRNDRRRKRVELVLIAGTITLIAIVTLAFQFMGR
jgi:hypothetical protein